MHARMDDETELPAAPAPPAEDGSGAILDELVEAHGLLEATRSAWWSLRWMGESSSPTNACRSTAVREDGALGRRSLANPSADMQLALGFELADLLRISFR